MASVDKEKGKLRVNGKLHTISVTLPPLLHPFGISFKSYIYNQYKSSSCLCLGIANQAVLRDKSLNSFPTTDRHGNHSIQPSQASNRANPAGLARGASLNHWGADALHIYLVYSVSGVKRLPSRVHPTPLQNGLEQGWGYGADTTRPRLTLTPCQEADAN